MEKIWLAFLLTVFLFVPSVGLANSICVDLDKVSPATAAQVGAALAEANTPKTPTVKDMDQYLAYGDKIAEVIKAVCHTLNVEVNEFIKTPVGKLISILIIYKVAGGLLLGFPLWVILTLVTYFSFRYFHKNERLEIKDEKGKIVDIKHIPRFKWESDDAKCGSAWVHGIFFVVITIVFMIVAF